MAYKFERKLKYLVLKEEDINKYLDERSRIFLLGVENAIAEGRKMDGKKVNSYVVVNEDEPYAEKVWELIEQTERARDL